MQKQLIFKIDFKPSRIYKLQQLFIKLTPQLKADKYLQIYKKQLNITVFQIQAQTPYHKYMIFKRIQDFTKLYKTLKNIFKNIMSPPIYQQKQSIDLPSLLNFYVLFLNSLSLQIKQSSQFLHFIYQPIKKQQRLKKIYIQCELQKHAGGRANQSIKHKINHIFKRNWKKRVFTVTNQGIYYAQQQKNNITIKDRQTFTSHFFLTYGQKITKNKLGIWLNFPQRTLQVKAQNIFIFLTFINAINISIHQNQILKINRYSSFSQQRNFCQAKYLIDGQIYFEQLYKALILAKSEVFIIGWMISPYFLLVRPRPLDSPERLDKVLKKLADSGVKISIILFKQLKFALNNDSQYVEEYFRTLSSNIQVIRHPNFNLIPFLWSHHQKMVIIDQKIVFMGGLDLCYGRLDNPKHSLTDLQSQIHFWQGADYCNYRISDIYHPRDYKNSIINRQSQPRIPWHDIGVSLRGNIVLDFVRHFVQYWSFVNYQNMKKQNQIQIKSFKFNKINEQQKSQQQQKQQQQNKQNRQIFSDQQNSEEIQENQLFNCQKQDTEIIASNNQQHQYYQSMKFQFQRMSTIYIPLKKMKSSNQYQKYKHNNQHEKKNRNLIVNNFDQKVGKQNVQLLRSSSKWSLGLQNTQRSIYNAYIQLIQNAQSFIYIQNQFFMSVQNKISQILIKKIQSAYKQKTQLKIIVMMPLLPAFQGDIVNQNSTILRIQLHFQYQTISRGLKSIYQKLKHIPLDQYIQFFSLRTHSCLKGYPITQILYIHSKLLIIDDNIALIGSANINDRSLLGQRDSQLAVVIQDQQQINYELKKKKITKKKFAHNLRVQLFMQHFGLTFEEAKDPQLFWNLIRSRSLINTSIFKKIFKCYPDDDIHTFQALKQFRKQQINVEQYNNLKQFIKGRAVIFPRNFLKDENLKFKKNQKQFYLPQISFT